MRGTSGALYIVIRTIVFILLFLPLSAVFYPADSFPIPEKLRYDLTWKGIKTGEAELEVRQEGNDIQLISRAKSSAFISIFYRVEDVVTSTIKRGENRGNGEGLVGLPYNYRAKIREGKQRRNIEFIMDHAARKATFINYLSKEKKTFDINESEFDPLSSFYFVRTLPLEVGKSVFIDIFDRKLYRTEVQVLKREVIATSAGTFKTVLIKPVMKSEGIFFRKGDILIWLTDDNRRIPVMLQTKVAFGSVTATLVSEAS